MTKTDLIFASLIGGAIGDSLGADIEFKRGKELPSNRPLKMSTSYGVDGAITDDTQMTLFTAEGISLSNRESDDDVIREVACALLRWYETQSYRGMKKAPNATVMFGLAKDKRLNKSRAPGSSCLTSLGGFHRGKPPVNSLGCGTIMRVAPVGLAFDDLARVFEVAIETSRITHDHIEGYLPAAIWAGIINLAAKGMNIREILKNEELFMRAKAEDFETAERMFNRLEAIIAATPDKRKMRKAIESLGNSFHAEGALYIAFAACVWGENLDHAYMLAVNNDSDSDTTGAIAGNLLGILYPDEVINSKWFKQVECRDLIKQAAEDLAA